MTQHFQYSGYGEEKENNIGEIDQESKDRGKGQTKKEN